MRAMMKFFKTDFKNVAVLPSITQNLVTIGRLVKHLSGETFTYMNDFVRCSKLYKKKRGTYKVSHLRAEKFEWCIHPVALSWPRHSGY